MRSVKRGEIAQLADTADEGGGRELREADAEGAGFLVTEENERFGDFLGGEGDVSYGIGGGEIFFSNSGDGSGIGIKDPDDIFCADVLIVANVEIHKKSFLVLKVSRYVRTNPAIKVLIKLFQKFARRRRIGASPPLKRRAKLLPMGLCEHYGQNFIFPGMFRSRL